MEDTRPGKRVHSYWKSPSLIGKSTINGPFSIANCWHNQRVFQTLHVQGAMSTTECWVPLATALAVPFSNIFLGWCWSSWWKSLLDRKCWVNISGWWFEWLVYLPLWKIWVSWDDDIPHIRENKIHVPNHQAVWETSVSDTLCRQKMGCMSFGSEG